MFGFWSISGLDLPEWVRRDRKLDLDQVSKFFGAFCYFFQVISVSPGYLWGLWARPSTWDQHSLRR